VSSKTNGLHTAARDRHAAAAHSAKPKPNGADHGHQHETHGNSNGNGARPADFIQPLGATHVDSRVDLLLAALPAADKSKMLCAWLKGDL
jgi:hypothetical protein